MPVLKKARYELFAQNVAKGQSQADAHENAGFKRNDGNASKLAGNPDVAARIKEIKAMGAALAVEATGVTKEMIVAELKKIGFSNMMDYITIGADGLPFVDMTAIDRDKGAAIQEVVVETKSEIEIGEDGKREAVPVRKVRFRLADKRAALVDMGRHLNMFNDDAPVVPEKHDGKTSAEMLLEILEEMRQLGITPEMLAPRPMIDVSGGVANRPSGKNGSEALKK